MQGTISRDCKLSEEPLQIGLRGSILLHALAVARRSRTQAKQQGKPEAYRECLNEALKMPSSSNDPRAVSTTHQLLNSLCLSTMSPAPLPPNVPGSSQGAAESWETASLRNLEAVVARGFDFLEMSY